MNNKQLCDLLLEKGYIQNILKYGGVNLERAHSLSLENKDLTIVGHSIKNKVFSRVSLLYKDPTEQARLLSLQARKKLALKRVASREDTSASSQLATEMLKASPNSIKTVGLVGTKQFQRAIWDTSLSHPAQAEQMERVCTLEDIRKELKHSPINDLAGANGSEVLRLHNGVDLLVKRESGLNNKDDLQTRDNRNSPTFAAWVDKTTHARILPLTFDGEFKGEKANFMVMVPGSVTLAEVGQNINLETDKGHQFNSFHFTILDGDHFQHGGNDMVIPGKDPYHFTIDPSTGKYSKINSHL